MRRLFSIGVVLIMVAIVGCHKSKNGYPDIVGIMNVSLMVIRLICPSIPILPMFRLFKTKHWERCNLTAGLACQMTPFI